MKLRCGACVCVEVLRTSLWDVIQEDTVRVGALQQYSLGGWVETAKAVAGPPHSKAPASEGGRYIFVSGVFCVWNYAGRGRSRRRVRGVSWRPSWLWWIGGRGRCRVRRRERFR